jgi:hypothetical protein
VDSGPALSTKCSATSLELRRSGSGGEVEPPLPSGADFNDLDSLAFRWETVERDRLDLLSGKSEQDLDEALVYIRPTRHIRERLPLWMTMLHITNHTTHHRAEALTALTAFGHPTESVDLIDYLRETVKSAQSSCRRIGRLELRE